MIRDRCGSRIAHPYQHHVTLMAENVSYVKEAIKEPLNIWMLVIFVALAVFAVTAAPGYSILQWLAWWIPLAAGATAEALYLSTVPNTPGYKRLVNQRARRRALVDRGRRREDLIKTFDPREREAVEYLRWMKNQIYQNYQKFTPVTDLPERIQTLDVYWESYVDLLDTYGGAKPYALDQRQTTRTRFSRPSARSPTRRMTTPADSTNKPRVSQRG